MIQVLIQLQLVAAIPRFTTSSVPFISGATTSEGRGRGHRENRAFSASKTAAFGTSTVVIQSSKPQEARHSNSNSADPLPNSHPRPHVLFRRGGKESFESDTTSFRLLTVSSVETVAAFFNHFNHFVALLFVITPISSTPDR
ncbi:unnamed protein product [Protopolystoma xenopodis]|uniref:Uncharacterized protein n=1 Tax=Protopolystoma xenopodis TaxID=117903 RepID=A0A3S5BAK2_9PLAT|nr:unnamed protein product [Protopolystoma xenopodis]